ncbi:hypothetical protein F5Y08DRAFT_355541 [Xylaria arbuscula]|nr:hypothetical protein F5Y08DRAFT_355541 [Xylaria arbuscula]
MAPEVMLTQQKCANIGRCNNLGKIVCTGCYLTMYCSPACQKMNWSVHKVDCHTRPIIAAFETERRLPAWAPQNLYADLMRKHRRRINPQDDPPQIGPRTRREFLGDDPRSGHFEMFGSYPAIDILQLGKNEGVQQTDPVDLLFVQPADLRDVIKTILGLPDDISAPINVFLTDHAMPKTVRNLILLLMALSAEDPDATAECAVHFWYGPFIPKWCLPAIRELVGPFLDEFQPTDEGQNEEAEPVNTKQWSFGSASLSAVLTQHMLKQGECANLDHYERTLTSFPLEWQAAKRRYMPSALVAPFENHSSPSIWPLGYNPSLFYGNFWPLKQDADPLRGWDLYEVNKNEEIGAARNDIYGKLFYHVRDLFKRFILKLRTAKVTFHVLPFSGYDFADETSQRFDRIETAALADEDLVGVRTIVDTLSPLLKPPSVNPHATMITLHPRIFDKIRSAFPCPECDPDRAERIKAATQLTPEERRLLDHFLPLADPDPVNWIYTAAGWQRRDARWLFRDPAAAWDLYKDIYDFADVADGAKVAMRTTHKVVSEWILRPQHIRPNNNEVVLKNSSDNQTRHPWLTSEAKWEFEALFARRQTTGYRYVEWRKRGANEKRNLEKTLKKDNNKDARQQQRKDGGGGGGGGGNELKRHEVYHEYLSDIDMRWLERKGARLETWMGKENCANWTPY